MANYHKQNSQLNNKKKVSISYVIRDKEERCHRAGINSLQYDDQLDRLYSAGRDSVIRIWGFSSESPSSTNNYGSNYNQRNNSPPINNNINNRRVFVGNNDPHLQSMEHHTDWVNDISLCCQGRNLISVSNDTTIKVWNAHMGFCLSTLRSHKDYVKCLAYSKDRETLASAGFDRTIYLWDVQALTMLSATKNTVSTKTLDGSKDSIYSLAINQSATLIASGSTEKVIRLWDPRSRQKLLKLKGHTDNVRSLIISSDGNYLLSASSDSTIRLWSIGQQRCISIIRAHDEGVWTMQTDENFNTLYSGSKDGKVFMTDLKQTSSSALICEEQESILKLLLVDRYYENNQAKRKNGASSLWVATSESCIKNWPLLEKHYYRDTLLDQDRSEIPIHSKPDVLIEGNPSVINYHILNDKRHILTRESDFCISLYDVLTAMKVDVLHSSNNEQASKEKFDMEIKKRSQMVYVPNWFSVDLKIGLLCIHLEESECFSAWISARDYGFLPSMDGPDPKLNFGRLMLLALLEHWPATYDRIEVNPDPNQRDSSPDDQHGSWNNAHPNPNRTKHSMSRSLETSPTNAILERVGNQYFSIPNHTPIIISEGNQTLMKFQAFDACNENENLYLNEIIPPWIADIVISKAQPKFTKIPFFLLPHPNSAVKTQKKERLTASDMLQLRKVKEHVCEKILVNSTTSDDNGAKSQSNQDQTNSARGSNSSAEPINSGLSPDKIELFCNDQKLEDHMDMRTVKHFIWKSGGDLILHFVASK